LTKVSVVLPTFNRASVLSRAVDSVLAQTFADFELIIVDDGSTDNTVEYLHSIEDKRVRVVLLTENRGIGGARNAGIAAARGKYIAFQDSDDEWLVTFLHRQVKNLDAAAEDVGVSYCGKIVYGRDEHGVHGRRRAAYMPDAQRKVVDGDIHREVLRNAVVSTQTFVAKADILRNSGGFAEDLRIGLDWELSSRLARLCKYSFIDEPLVMTFLMPDSVSHRKHESFKTLSRILENNADVFEADPDLHATMLLRMASSLIKTRHHRQAQQFVLQAFRRAPGKRAASLLLLNQLSRFADLGRGSRTAA